MGGAAIRNGLGPLEKATCVEITNHGHRPWYEVGPPEGAITVR
jgi:hypothetical protein